MPYIIRDKNYQIHDLTPPHTGYNRIQHPHIKDERLVRILFFIFGVITDLLAVAVLAFTIYSPNSQSLKSFLELDENEAVSTKLSGFYILLVSSVLMILVSILGFWSVLVDGRPQLFFYQILTTLLLTLTISGLICIWAYSYAVRWYMSNYITENSNEINKFDSAFFKFQNDNKCCGFMDSNDWLSSKYTYGQREKNRQCSN